VTQDSYGALEERILPTVSRELAWGVKGWFCMVRGTGYRPTAAARLQKTAAVPIIT
jgi:hypothetical protein